MPHGGTALTRNSSEHGKDTDYQQGPTALTRVCHPAECRHGPARKYRCTHRASPAGTQAHPYRTLHGSACRLRSTDTSTQRFGTEARHHCTQHTGHHRCRLPWRDHGSARQLLAGGFHRQCRRAYRTDGDSTPRDCRVYRRRDTRRDRTGHRRIRPYGGKMTKE